eukprot:7229267-Prymnesium_polylepis.1
MSMTSGSLPSARPNFQSLVVMCCDACSWSFCDVGSSRDAFSFVTRSMKASFFCSLPVAEIDLAFASTSARDSASLA